VAHPTPQVGHLHPISSVSATREQLLEKIRNDKNLPTLGVAITKVIEITSSSDESIADLAHYILSDVALTQQILRLANTTTYRAAGGVAVTTVSRAIFLLGFDAIKANALAALLVSGFRDQHHAHLVRKELVQALCASVAAREISKLHHRPNSEEAAVAALFKNLGRVLLAYFDHHRYEQIIRNASERKLSTSQVCIEYLGCSFERLGEMVLHEWKIPESIIYAVQSLHFGEVKKSHNAQEWLKQVSSLCEGIGEILIASEQEKSNIHEQSRALLNRFGNALEINHRQFNAVIEHVQTQAHQLAISLNVELHHHSKANKQSFKESDFCTEFMLPAFETQQLQTNARYPSGKPKNARDLLLAGVQDAAQMLASSNLKLNDLLLLVLETLHHAMGFRFATACLSDLQKTKYVARLSVGERYAERQKGFQFLSSETDSVFQLALANNVDLMVEDALNPKIQSMLPAWHQQQFPDTRSFIILPLVVEQRPLGLFYADRSMAAPEGVPPDETALIKTLKGQLLTAMTRRSN
jgi:HD-like signal output (HDOD) protein/GAF domain-containing protein